MPESPAPTAEVRVSASLPPPPRGLTSRATSSSYFTPPQNETLSAEMQALAKKKGLCVYCKVPTHKRLFGGLGPLVPRTDRDIWKGICRSCFPDQVPREGTNNKGPKPDRQAQEAISPNLARPPSILAEARVDSTASNISSVSALYGLRNNIQETGGLSRDSMTSGMMGSSNHSLWTVTEFVESSSMTWQSPRPIIEDISEHELSQSSDRGNSAEFLLNRELLLSISESHGNLDECLPSPPSPQLTREYTPEEQRRLDDDTAELISLVEQFSLSSDYGSSDTDLLNRVWIKLKPGLNASLVAQCLDDMLKNNSDLDEAASRLVCGILWKVSAISADPAVGSLDAYSNCFKFVLNALNRNRKDAATVEWAMGALTCALWNASYDGVSQVVESSSIEFMVTSMYMHRQNARILEWTARCILLLLDFGQPMTEQADSANNIRLAEKIAAIFEQVQAVKLLCETMKATIDASAHLWSLQAVWRLTSGRIALSNEDSDSFDEYALALLGRQDLTSRTILLTTLDLLCGIIDVSPTHSKAFSTANAKVVFAISLMKKWKSDERLLAACCRIFFALARGEVTTRHVLRQTKVLQAMIDAIQLFPSSLEIAGILFGTFWRLASIDVTFFSLGQARQLLEATEAIVMEQGLSSPSLICAACGFIGIMSSTEGLNLIDLHFSVILHALHVFGDDSTVYEEACDALARMIERFNEVSTLAMESVVEFAKQSHDTSSTKLIIQLLQALPEEKREQYCARLVSILLKQTKTKKSYDLEPTINDKIYGIVLVQPTMEFDFEDDLVLGACQLISWNEAPLQATHEACIFIWSRAFHQTRLAEQKLMMMQMAVVEYLRRLYESAVVDASLVMAASGTLACCTRRLRHSNIDVAGAVHILLSLLNAFAGKTGSVDVLERLLDALAEFCSIQNDTFAASVVIDTMMEIMTLHDNDAGIQERGCAILAHFASSETLQAISSFIDNDGDGVEVLLQCQQITHNITIQKNFCSAVRLLCCEEDARTLFIERGSLQILCSLLTADGQDLRLLQLASAAIGQLIPAEILDVSMLDMVGMVDSLTATMIAHPGDLMLQSTCLSIFLGLLAKGPSLRTDLMAHGALDILLSAAVTFDGCSVIMNKVLEAVTILHTGDRGHHVQLNVRSIQIIVDGFTAAIENEESQRCGCTCLAALSEREELRPLIRKARGNEAVARAACAHSTSERVAVPACRALANLARSEGQALDVEISAVVLLMTYFDKSSTVQELGCSILGKFLPSQSNAVAMKSAPLPVINAVLNASTAFPEQCSFDATVVLSALDSTAAYCIYS